MARPTSPREAPPAEVRVAVMAFRSEMSTAILRFFVRHPGSRQSDAVDVLGPQAIVSRGIAELIQQGLLIESPTEDGRSRSYTADIARVRRLLAQLEAYVLDPDDRG